MPRFVLPFFALLTLVRLPIFAGIDPFGTALDTSLGFTTGGDADWFVQTDVVRIGDSAARSGTIGHAGETWIETTVSGPGTLSFWWKTSSEIYLGMWTDLVVFSDNTSETHALAGDTEWQFVVVSVAGEGDHTLRWRYFKDYASSFGQDCAWLDGITWTPADETTAQGTPTVWLNSHGLLSGIDPETADLADVDTDGHVAWQEYVSGSDPTNTASVLTTTITVGPRGRTLRWTPDLGAARAYTVEGAESLPPTWGPTNAASRFFRISVDLP